jgi:chorismate mutase
MKILGRNNFGITCQAQTQLFDIDQDPGQKNPVTDPAVEDRMCRHIARLFQENDAPPEQYIRLGLEQYR